MDEALVRLQEQLADVSDQLLEFDHCPQKASNLKEDLESLLSNIKDFKLGSR